MRDDEMIGLSWNIPLKWMIWGTPIYGHLQLGYNGTYLNNNFDGSEIGIYHPRKPGCSNLSIIATQRGIFSMLPLYLPNSPRVMYLRFLEVLENA